MRKRSVGFLACLATLLCVTGVQAQSFTTGKWTPGLLQLSQDGTRLFASFDNYTPEKWQHAVRSWDIESGRVATHAVLPDAVGGSQHASVFSPGGRFYAHRTTIMFERRQSAPTTIRDTQTGAIVSTPEETDATVIPLAFSPDDKLLVGVSTEKPRAPQFLKTWDTATGKAVPLFDAVEEKERVSHIFFSADNRLVLRLGWKMNPQQKVRRWAVVFDRATGKKTTEYYLDDKALGEFALVSKENGEKLEGLGNAAVLRYGDWQYELSPDGRYLAGVPSQAVADKHPAFVVLWDTRTGAQVRQLPLKAAAGRLHFSADGSQLTSVGLPTAHTLFKHTWETDTGKVLAALDLPFSTIYAFDGRGGAISIGTMNSRWFAQFTNREIIKVYSLESGELVRTIKVEDF